MPAGDAREQVWLRDLGLLVAATYSRSKDGCARCAVTFIFLMSKSDAPPPAYPGGIVLIKSVILKNYLFHGKFHYPSPTIAGAVW